MTISQMHTTVVDDYVDLDAAELAVAELPRRTWPGSRH